MQQEFLLDLTAFDAPEHQPFLWEGGAPVALLVHGFPGTPAELRPLAQQLFDAGWSVQGLLLPGFGAQIATLAERTHDEWVQAITNAITELRKQHRPVVLIGFSLGAALSIQAAAAVPPDALVLLAPFWQLGSWWSRPVVQVLRPFFPQFKPFRLLKPNFDDPEFRQGILNFMPGLALEETAVQQAVLEFAIPTKMIAQIQQAGAVGFRKAAEVPDIPTLLLQGREDEIVPHTRTRRLLTQFQGPIQYHELDAGHDLLKPDQAAWPDIVRLTQTFLEGFAQETG